LHFRELLEQGFQAAVVRDAAACPRAPERGGYPAAMTNLRFLAPTLWTSEEIVQQLQQPTAVVA
jgi:hypothetical protein